MSREALERGAAEEQRETRQAGATHGSGCDDAAAAVGVPTPPAPVTCTLAAPNVAPDAELGDSDDGIAPVHTHTEAEHAAARVKTASSERGTSCLTAVDLAMQRAGRERGWGGGGDTAGASHN